MSFYGGINFRNSSGYVTDGTGETYCGLNDYYPTTRGGLTFGIETSTAPQWRDRNSGVDRRCAGNFRDDADAAAVFRLDISITTGDVAVAAGDNTYGGVSVGFDLKDGTTTFASLASTTTSGAGKFYDASGVERTSAANWASANVPVNRTFGTSILRIVMKGVSHYIAHISVNETGGAGITPIRRQQTRQRQNTLLRM